MAWIYLICAGLMEMGWPVGLKMAQQEGSRVLGICVAIAFMAASGFFALAGATRDTYRHVLCGLDEHRCGGDVYDWRVVLRRRGEPVEIFWRAFDT